MKNNYIKIKVENNSHKFISFLIYNNINYKDLVKLDKYYTLIIKYDDINKFYRFKYQIIKYYGINGILKSIDYNRFVIIGILCGLLLLMLLKNTIFSVDIITDDIELKNIINNSLIENGIVKYKRKRSFKEINSIKEIILDQNKDTLEWIEIIEDGCNYKVELTKRVIGNKTNDSNYPSNIVASRDGLLLHINLTKGVQVKDVKDYVKKGDIIITGNIYKGEKLVKQIPSIGKVYAEVWYVVNVTIPFEYTEYVETGKVINHYYINMFNRNMTLVGKYDSDKVISEKKLILDKPYLLFDLYKETKKVYEYRKINVNEKEAYNEGVLRAESKIIKTLNDDEYIMYKKVLKKEVFSSKMELEVFFKVYENITNISRIEEVNDAE